MQRRTWRIRAIEFLRMASSSMGGGLEYVQTAKSCGLLFCNEVLRKPIFFDDEKKFITQRSRP